MRVVGVPVRLSATPGAVRTPSPALGEHTGEVLSKLLGLGAPEIDALRAAGALG
jgi:crotonobetainyl-CoA:carnitine CoA-transferase CaiB-like acyl-CoA transferase